ncbi:MAG: hypothetical protein U0892_20530 [Pirellulales bacterium]
MTDLRFIGDLSPLVGIVLALSAGALAWWLYARETRVLSGPARYGLPLLRSAAIVLSILILTAPVLHHRYREGEPGKLVVMVDSSASMSINDTEMAADRKQAIAASLDWVDRAQESDGGSNSTISSSADAGVLRRFDESTRYQRALERLLSGADALLPQVQDSFEITVSRFDRDRTVLWESGIESTSPLPDSTQPWTPERFGAASRIGGTLIEDAERSMQSTRPEEAADANKSDEEAAAVSLENNSSETVVLLTDGRNTLGPSTQTAAEALAAQKKRVYVIGVGHDKAPQDISLAAVNHPERVFERDVLRGTIVLNHRMAKNEPLKLSIRHAGQVIWQETHALTPEDRGRVDFSIPAEPLVKQLREQAGRNVEFAAVPLHLEAVVESQAGETVLSNNSRPFHVSVVTKRSRLLILEGRSRWEVRYLRNMFERDPAWQVDTVMPDWDAKPPVVRRGDGPDQWPVSREKLAQYDLIVLGDLPAETLPNDAQNWIKYFVEASGGGLIVIDGDRDYLQAPAYKTLHDLLPVKWLKDERSQPPPVAAMLTSAARQSSAFLLTPNEPAASERAWSELPPLHYHSLVEAVPGSEVLLQGKNEAGEVPLMVTRQFGAGRVFYAATDETWRWRYKVADTYHQRFWNQIARWVMRMPMSVQGQYVGLDSGKLVVGPGDTIPLKARLRNADGTPAADLAVEAIVSEIIEAPSKGGSDATSKTEPQERVIAVVPLESDKAVAGVYAGQMNAPRGGNYRVRITAPGLTNAALDLHTEFSVVEPDAGEMDQPACDTVALTRLAELTGGAYLPEEKGHELIGLLQPLSRGKIVESDTLLWQSYWWFAPIVMLLCAEWWIRKRVGLI